MIKQNNKRTSIIMSIVALLLILTLAAGFTFSWAEGGSRGKVDGNSLVINSGSDLVMRQDDKVVSDIIIPVTNLEPVSSADGRNFFVPMEYNTSVDTDEMFFREGAPIDVNKKYVSIDFQLQAGEDITPVYLGAGTGVTCSDQSVLEALRMSFSLNDAVNDAKIENDVITVNKDPLVFKPNQMPGVKEEITFSPITAITDAGKASTTTTASKAYGDYYFKGEGKSTPIFKLAKGETKNITLTIWLEGTVATVANAGKNLDIYIDFTTTTSDLTKYSFVDNTHGPGSCKPEYWITETEESDNIKYETMMYLYDANSKRYYAMSKSDNYDTDRTWDVYVPSTISNFTFRRYSIDLNICWNEWVPSMYNIPSNNTFIAICGVRNVISDAWQDNVGPCGGYWQTKDDSIRVYFQLEANWTDLHCYIWDSDETEFSLNNGTGTLMNFSHNNEENSKPVYYVDIPSISEVGCIEFNNGKNSTDAQRYQIKNKDYFFTGFTTWYKSNSDNGVFLYKGELNNLLWNSVTVYADDYNYDDHYMWFQDGNGVTFGKDWPGYEMHYDNVTNLYKISLITDEPLDVFINNKGKGDQWPMYGEDGLPVVPGKSYYLTINQDFYEYYP